MRRPSRMQAWAGRAEQGWPSQRMKRARPGRHWAVPEARFEAAGVRQLISEQMGDSWAAQHALPTGAEAACYEEARARAGERSTAGTPCSGGDGLAAAGLDAAGVAERPRAVSPHLAGVAGSERSPGRTRQAMSATQMRAPRSASDSPPPRWPRPARPVATAVAPGTWHPSGLLEPPSSPSSLTLSTRP